MALLAAMAAERSALSIHMACLAAVVDVMADLQQKGTVRMVGNLLVVTSLTNSMSTTPSVTLASGSSYLSLQLIAQRTVVYTLSESAPLLCPELVARREL